MEGRGVGMKPKPAKALPKIAPLPGSVCPQFRRCGKPNCHCASGELHGAYFYRFWRENGKLKKEYVPRAEVERVRSACASYREAQTVARQERQQGWQTFRELLHLLRNLEKQTG